MTENILLIVQPEDILKRETNLEFSLGLNMSSKNLFKLLFDWILKGYLFVIY